MSTKYIVAEGHEFDYPATPQALQIILNAGGRSKLTEEQKAFVTYKFVKAGEDCSDMPANSLELYLERGWVLEVKYSEPIPSIPDPVTDEEDDNG